MTDKFAALRPATRLDHGGTLRTPFGGTSEALFLAQGVNYEAAAARGWALQVCRPDRGEPMPRLGPGQALLVLGGPMGVGDIGSPSFPWLEAEVVEMNLTHNKLSHSSQ